MFLRVFFVIHSKNPNLRHNPGHRYLCVYMYEKWKNCASEIQHLALLCLIHSNAFFCVLFYSIILNKIID